MALFMLGSLGWGYFILTDSLEKWHAAILLTIHGMAGVLWNPAGQLLVHDMVGGQQLQSAIRMMSSARMLGFLMDPAIGGGLMLAFGPAVGILINISIYLPLTLWLWKAPYGPKFQDKAKRTKPPRAVNNFADVKTIKGTDMMLIKLPTAVNDIDKATSPLANLVNTFDVTPPGAAAIIIKPIAIGVGKLSIKATPKATIGKINN